ncbi:hypothetical protein C7S16_2685 [Burkholderia thailandensis]|uniref:Uncharacterized protein n=1 Tax=Burkholderia thailandensis TaxID=57975 RepID=A0AAW9CRV7_BURTH|nr:hypothetical protein [Burkholderia thailandensis]MDW9253765.1 hypothetical protein [Burkholderia thailandensis]
MSARCAFIAFANFAASSRQPHGDARAAAARADARPPLRPRSSGGGA